VWTPKRIVLLAVGFVMFSTAYFCYAHFLGGIDGLPPLPSDYLPISFGLPRPLPPPRPLNSADSKLRMAFGDECPEVRDRKIKLELSKSGMVLATQDATPEKDGRLRLVPFSLAVFSKDTGDKTHPEITTVRSQEAYLTFDEPITNLLSVKAHKILKATLLGDIFVVNNRRTPERDDDISVFTQGPLEFDDAMNKIWTENPVRVTDPQSKPKPMTIAGTGMDLFLTKEEKEPAQKPLSGQKPHKRESLTGVERIRLRSDVEMNLWVEKDSGFLGAGKPADVPAKTQVKPLGPPGSLAGKPQQPPIGEKAKVIIMTQGPFDYDMKKDRATFDALQKSPRPNFVTVNRINEAEGKLDHLECDHLELQFHRKNPSQKEPATDGRPEGLEIETAHATGKEVILTSDAEMLDAHGNDFFYDKRTLLSTLKGEPQMWALKEGNEIHAPELQLLDQKGAQQATALGAGYVRMLDKEKGSRTLEAHWKDKLVYGKDGVHDLLILYGDAAFVDKEQHQQLRAQLLKVWLEPSAKGDPNAKTQQQARPHHLDAIGSVTADAADMRIHDTERLTLWFKDAPPAGGQLPSALPDKPAAAQAAQATRPLEGEVTTRPPEPGSNPTASPVKGAAPGQVATTPAKPKKPMDLSARQVEAHLLRTGSKNDLDRLLCQGTVLVKQEPETPEERGTDIRGDTLELDHHIDGNVLTVTGNHAQVQLNKVFILGPTVKIDQTTNEVWVTGIGLMRMPSNSNFDGSKSAKTSEMTVNWEKSMLFNGQVAEFKGSVRAEQDTGRLACQALTVTLDRKISLRENEKNTQTAKMTNLVCDREAWLEDIKRDGQRIVAFKSLECPDFTLDNENEEEGSLANASGPGTVRMFGHSDNNNFMAPPNAPKPQPAPGAAPKQAAKTEDEPKLTYVRYQGKMTANNKKGIAKFFDRVVVIHVPTTKPDLPINESHPPRGSMYVSCGRLVVLRYQLRNGTFNQEMQAFDKVYITSEEFSGNASVVKYDENQEKVILEGTDGNLAVLNRVKNTGGEREVIEAKKITYYRRTGTFEAPGSQSIRAIN